MKISPAARLLLIGLFASEVVPGNGQTNLGDTPVNPGSIPVPPGPQDVFSITEFIAGCTQHANFCSYRFFVTRIGIGEFIGKQCNITVLGDGTGALPKIDAGECINSGRTWSIIKDPTSAGFTLKLKEEDTPASWTIGQHSVDPAKVQWQNGGTTWRQQYVGDQSFNLQSVAQ